MPTRLTSVISLIATLFFEFKLKKSYKKFTKLVKIVTALSLSITIIIGATLSILINSIIPLLIVGLCLIVILFIIVKVRKKVLNLSKVLTKAANSLSYKNKTGTKRR